MEVKVLSRKEQEAEQLRRRKKALRRFKTLVRIVMHNRTWLLEAEEGQKLSLNVKKNIEMLVRPRQKIGILTLPEKSLLRTNHFLRTVKERKRLVSLFASLACFSHFAPSIRARLVPVATFSDLQTNRVLIREGSEPIMMYFILYGEVEIYKKVYNPMTKQFEDKFQAILGNGDCVGEMEFLENFSKRRSTYVSSMDTEVLVVLKDDFDRILRPVMSKQWEEKKVAMKAMQYFEFFTNEQLLVACKLGSIRQFNPLETIYHMDKGMASYVYFVIGGECMILQCLTIKTSIKNGKKTYALMDVSKETTTEMFGDFTHKEMMKKLLEENKQDKEIYASEEESETNEPEKGIGISTKSQKTSVMDIEKLCASKKGMQNELQKPSEHLTQEEMSTENIEEFGNKKFMHSDIGLLDNSMDLLVETNDSTVINISYNSENNNHDKMTSQDRIGGGKETSVDHLNSAIKNQQNEGENKKERSESSGSHKSKETTRQSTDKDNDRKPSSENVPGNEFGFLNGKKGKTLNAEEIVDEPVNHFIDVGSVTFGGIFGLGETMEQRVIIAQTTVHCLLLPRFWLMDKEQNPGNVWQRRRFYLDCTIPSRQTLFKNFLATLKWQKFKNELIASKINEASNINHGKVQDIPIICRLTEGEG